MHTALLGLAGFVLYAIFGVILLGTDRPLATVGRAAQSLWNKVTRGRRPVTGLDQRLLAERDTIRAVLGRKWRQAIVLTAGRLGFDYGCLLAALRATGASPRPSLRHDPIRLGRGSARSRGTAPGGGRGQGIRPA